MTDTTNFIRLSDTVIDIRKKCHGDVNALFSTYRWDTKKDLRITSISRLTRLLVGLNVAFSYLSNSDQESIIRKIRLPSETNVNNQEYLIMNELFIKMGFAASLFFIVESTVREYLKYINIEAYEKAKGNGISHICKCLLEKVLEWDTYHSDCTAFNFLKLIRNTLHNNGIHIPTGRSPKNSQVTYRNQSYEFLDGTRIEFVTLDLLLDLANDMRTLLFQLSNNKTIRSQQGIIPDRLAL